MKNIARLRKVSIFFNMDTISHIDLVYTLRMALKLILQILLPTFDNIFSKIKATRKAIARILLLYGVINENLIGVH